MSEQGNLPLVPPELAGKWLYWTSDGLRIAGVGETPEQAEADAARTGVTEGIFEWAPAADEWFIGAVF